VYITYNYLGLLLNLYLYFIYNMNIIRSLIITILVVFCFFFLLGNISLMKLDNDNITKTPHNIKPIDGQQLSPSSIAEIEEYNKNLLEKSDSTCKSAKEQIIKMINKTDILNDVKSHVELENFDDYAPIDVPLNNVQQKPIIQYKYTDNDPKPSNTMSTQQTSKFSSDMTVPWSGQQGKEDLSYFFDTYAFEKSKIITPDNWEQQMKR